MIKSDDGPIIKKQVRNASGLKALQLITPLSMQELSDMTAIKADDILNTLQSLELIQYRKGQHVICADPKVLDRHLKAAGRGGLEVDVSKLIWTPYREQG